jgi:hypothetical protein
VVPVVSGGAWCALPVAAAAEDSTADAAALRAGLASAALPDVQGVARGTMSHSVGP